MRSVCKVVTLIFIYGKIRKNSLYMYMCICVHACVHACMYVNVCVGFFVRVKLQPKKWFTLTFLFRNHCTHEYGPLFNCKNIFTTIQK